MSNSPHKSIIVYGPQGTGKTLIADKLCKHFHLDRVIDAMDHPHITRSTVPMTGALILSNVTPPEEVRHKLHIDQARDYLNTRPAGYPF